MYALGLYADAHLLKIALVKKERGQATVELLRAIDTREALNLTELLKPLLQRKETILVTALEADQVVFRELKLKVKKEREILSVLPFQSESLIPFPLDQALLVPFSRPLGKTEAEVTLLATSKEHLEEHLKIMESYALDPDRVSVVPAALWRYARCYSSSSVATLLHFGLEKSCALSFSKEKILFSQTLPIGLEELTLSLKKDHPEKSIQEVDFSILTPEEFPQLSATVAKLKRELERLSAFLEKKGVSREFSMLGNLPPSLRYLLGSQTPEEAEEHSSYEIPIGLALEGLYQDPTSVQLREQEFAPSRLMKNRIKQLSFCLLGIGALTLATLGSSQALISKKQTALTQQIAALKGVQLEDSKASLISHVRGWATSLTGQKVPFPYKLTAPKVSDVLAWISTHPHLSDEGLSVNRVQYDLVKYPLIGKSQSPYQGKVEIEFTASSATLARAFHDSLLKGEGLVNTQHEIGWSVHENKYITTFILKGIYQ